jgi:hypothetical protein
MKISHTQLEDCRANPRAWIQARAGADPFFTLGYNQALLHAIHQYHKAAGDARAARKYLEGLIERHFKNENRSEQIQEWLKAYIRWHRNSGVIVADSKFRIKLSVGVVLELRGEMHRFDFLPNGYRAMLLGTYAQNWTNQLRMPLLQRAAAFRFGRPVEDISIGVQYLDGSELEEKRYSRNEITKAEEDFRNLSVKVEGYARNIPGLLG